MREKDEDIDCASGQAGITPRVRGKGLAAKLEVRCARITPACAGKIVGDRLRGALGKDHPRVCGENL